MRPKNRLEACATCFGFVTLPALDTTPSGRFMDHLPFIIEMVLLGVGAGIISGSLGLGGGIIMVPAFMTFVAGMDTNTAKGTSLFLIVFISALNAFRQTHAWEHRPWRLAGMIAVGSIAGSYLGALVTTHMSERAVLVIFLSLIALLTVRTFFLTPRAVDQAAVQHRPWVAVGIGLLAGLFGGATGTGGGSVLIPLALLAGIVSNERVVGLSNMVMVATAISGTIAHLQAEVHFPSTWTVGQVYLPLVPIVFVGSQIGSPIGRRLNPVLTVPRRRVLMAALLLLITVRLTYRLFSL